MPRVGIGSKLLALIIVSLTGAITAIVWNATRLFREDNLNSIYVSSDLLTSSKAGEVRVWLDTVQSRARSLSRALQTSGGGGSIVLDDEFLAAQIWEPSGDSYRMSKSWVNGVQAMRAAVSEAAVTRGLQEARARWDVLRQGMTDIHSSLLNGTLSAVIVEMPMERLASGARVLRLAVRTDTLNRIFSESGPYLFYLVRNDGRVVSHPDPSRASREESLIQIPLVKRMLTSSMEREFQEFVADGISYLGAYSKVGAAGLAVLSQVPKSVALETGDVLVHRSKYIALFVFSAVMILAYLFVEQITSPVRALSHASRLIARGEFLQKVEVSTNDEMGDLAASFNAMGEEIQHKIEDLSLINDASVSISKTLEMQALLKLTIEKSMELVRCQRGLAWFKPVGSTPLTVRQNWYEAAELPIKSVLEAAAPVGKTKKPARVTVGDQDMIIAPILHRGQVAGSVVLAAPANPKGFRDENVFAVGTLLTNATSTFEVIQLMRETADKARMEKELETAKHVQDTMFPPKSIQAGSWKLESYYTPAAECGGDWWGYIDLPDDRALIAIGDATGHGVPSAMVTATARASCSVLQGLSKKPGGVASSPKLVLHFLNKAVYESTGGKIMMTFFVAVINKKTGDVTYASASHDPIYVYKRAEGEAIEPGTPGNKGQIDVLYVEPGARLGEQPEVFYQEATAKLGRGDFLILYTDGVPEGKNPALEEFDDRRFMRSIAKLANDGGAAIREQILDDFRKFTSGEALHDDVTLVVAEFLPPAQTAAVSAPEAKAAA